MIIRQIVLSALLATTVSGVVQVFLKPSSKSIEKKTGDNFMMQCKIKDDGADGSPPINVTKQPTWSFEKDNVKKTFTASGRNRVKFIDPFTTNLYITNAELSDAGTYECTAEASGHSLAANTKVALYKSIELVGYQPVQNPIEGKTARILCRATADPAPEITWFRKQKSSADDVEDTETVIDTSGANPRYSMDEDGQVLIINNFDTATDNGIYKCSINQVESGDMKDLNITIVGHVHPQIKHVSEAAEFNEATSGDISCAASGVPIPNFRWYKEENAVLEKGDEYDFPESGLLRILKATPNDAGSYTCEAFNSVGVTRGNVTVKIFLLPKIVQIQNFTAKKDDSLSIPCSYSGDEPLTAKWFSNHGEVPVVSGEQPSEPGVTVSPPEHNRYVSVDNERKTITLNIKTATLDDSGEYQCRVSNKAGNATAPAVVKIEHKPFLLERSPKTIRAVDDKILDLSCSVDALPLARWMWYQPDGNQIAADDAHLRVSNSEDQKKSKLEFQALSAYYGSYKCFATNEHGSDEWIMEVIKIETPPQPIIEVDSTFPTKARLSIKNYATNQDTGSIDEKTRPTKIELKYFPKESETAADLVELAVEDFNPTGFYEIYKLKPKTTYDISVKGTNEAGASDFFRFDYTTSDPEVPSPPAFVTGNFSECLMSSCTVQWSIPEDGGSSITRYLVMYKTTKVSVNEQQAAAAEGEFDQTKNEALAASPTSVEEGDWVKGEVPPGVQQIELKNLQSKTSYVVRVYAINGIGDSKPSPDLFIKTREFGIHDVMQSGVNAGAIVAIVIIVVLIFVLLVDVACYYVNQCGLLMCVCVSCCGKTSPEMKAKQIDTEQGKVMTGEKKPLHEIEDMKLEQGEDAPMITREKASELSKKDTPV